MSFLFPTLLWIGLPLIAVPVLIHLLHRGRQERIPWAAMQFLVESQKKYQRWVNLKQLLLLLARMAVVGVVALLVAQPLLQANWAKLFSQRPVYHVVLLDDSYSMTDRDQRVSAWSNALAVLDRLIATSASQSQSAHLTVMRFSDVLRGSEDESPPFESDITPASAEQLRTQIASWQPSETSAQFLDALVAISKYVGRQPPQREIVLHLLTDFRRRDWQDSAEIARQLESLSAKAVRIELIACAPRKHENLAITELAIDAGVEAADVEMWFRLSAQNFGDKLADAVSVDIVQDGRPQTAVSLGQIAAGQTVTKRFRATFAGEGDHWLAAQLEPDAVELDNYRYYAAQLPANQRVLIVDSSPDSQEASFLATALAPGGRARTGWETVVETPAGLARYDDLASFAAIAVLSVPRVATDALEKLEGYVQSGGGLWITADDTVDREFYNTDLFRDGEGLLALPLKFPAELESREKPADADLVVGAHAAMRVLSGARNDYLQLANIRMFYETRGQEGAIPADVQLLATLRNGAPYLVERRFGRGIAISQFGRLSPLPTRVGSWSNLAVNPAFPVLANEIMAYLARSGVSQPIYQVGQQFRAFDSQIRGLSLARVDALADGSSLPTSNPMDAKGRLWNSGLFRLGASQGRIDNQPSLLAVNVAPQEGNLAFLRREEIDARLGELATKVEIWSADELAARPESDSNGRLVDVLLVAVLGLLMSEQALAYWSSYHRRRNTPGVAA